MSARPVYLRSVRSLAALMLVACTGEQVVSEPADGGPPTDSAVSDVMDTGSCAPVAGNVVRNPSFEQSVMNVITNWDEAAEFVAPRTGGAVHCASWAEVHLRSATGMPVYWGQDFRIDPLPAKGQTLVATLYVKTLDTNIDLELVMGVSSGPNVVKAIVLPVDGQWKQYSIQFTATGDDVTYFVAVSTSSKNTVKLGLDHVVVTVVP